MAPGRGSTPCHATGPEVRVHAFVDRNRQRDVSVQAVTRRQLAAIVVAREKRPEKRWDRRAQGVRSRVLNVSEYGGARFGASQGRWDDDTRAENPHILAGNTSIPEAMLRFTSKCSLLLLAVMPRWAYADLECRSSGYLFDPSECHVEEMNRVFEGDLDGCHTDSSGNNFLKSNSKDRCKATAAKINGHADYKGAPAIGCGY
eukprot:gene14372-11431_t